MVQDRAPRRVSHMAQATSRRLCRLAGLVLATLLTAPALASQNKAAPDEPLDLNTATAEELTKLPGVGEAIAQRIVRHREKSGKFRKVEELLVIRGISRRKLEALRPYVTVQVEDSAEGKPKNTSKTQRMK